MKRKLALVVSMMVFGLGSSEAAIILTEVGDDLEILVENPIEFIVNRDVSSSRYGFTLPGAIDVAGTGGFQLSFDPATAPSIVGPGLNADEPGVGLIRGGPDLEVLYFLTSTVSLGLGDMVTLSPGVLSLPNFFSFSIINGLNYNIATEVILSETSGSPISDPTPTGTPIPEPSGFLLYATALSVLYVAENRKRRRVSNQEDAIELSPLEDDP